MITLNTNLNWKPTPNHENNDLVDRSMSSPFFFEYPILTCLLFLPPKKLIPTTFGGKWGFPVEKKWSNCHEMWNQSITTVSRQVMIGSQTPHIQKSTSAWDIAFPHTIVNVRSTLLSDFIRTHQQRPTDTRAHTQPEQIASFIITEPPFAWSWYCLLQIFNYDPRSKMTKKKNGEKEAKYIPIGNLESSFGELVAVFWWPTRPYFRPQICTAEERNTRCHTGNQQQIWISILAQCLT